MGLRRSHNRRAPSHFAWERKSLNTETSPLLLTISSDLLHRLAPREPL
jgi:hypothetical protein